MDRGNRYVVLKIDDINKYLAGMDKRRLEYLCGVIAERRLDDGKPKTEYVVVGSDWPMYEETWIAIEKWVDTETSP